MTQKQKTLVAGGLAIAVLCVSLSFWTPFFRTRIAQKRAVDLQEVSVTQHEMKSEQRTEVKEMVSVERVEPASLKAISKVVEEASEDTQHAAAPLDQRPKQLSKWGLHRGYTISIPGIGIRAPVLSPSRQYWDGREWDLLEEQMQVGLTFGAVQYPHSSAPGEDGALIIAGHSSPPSEEAEKSPYGHLFARLPELQFGDTISLLVGGSPVDYEVQEKKIVSPNQTSILAQMEDESTLRLITCYPVGTTKDRLVITAKLVD